MINNNVLNEINLNVILKYSIAGIVLSLLLSIIFYFLFSNTTYIDMEYSSYAFLGLYPLSFYLGVIISTVIFTSQIKNRADCIIVGFIIGLFTALLQHAVIVMFFGGQELMFFISYVGNQSVELVALGLLFAFLSNLLLKDKLNLPIIKKYLGE